MTKWEQYRHIWTKVDYGQKLTQDEIHQLIYSCWCVDANNDKYWELSECEKCWHKYLLKRKDQLYSIQTRCLPRNNEGCWYDEIYHQPIPIKRVELWDGIQWIAPNGRKVLDWKYPKR